MLMGISDTILKLHILVMMQGKFDTNPTPGLVQALQLKVVELN
jgi:hypothetical protein